MNSKILSAAIAALALSSCDRDQKKAETFVDTNSLGNVCSNDMTVGRVVARWSQSEGTLPIRMYLMIDTNGDETAEYVGYMPGANSSVLMGVSYNAEVTHQKKTIAGWSKILKDFTKIPQIKQESTR